MNGPQDLGGAMGFGPVAPDPAEPRFHAPWERRAMGLTLAAGALGHWSLDESRHARESLPPAVYHGSSYYGIWLRALTALLIRHGELAPEELEAGHALGPGRSADRRLAARDVPAALARGAPTDREAASPPRFAVGEAVRTRNIHTERHCRLPGYARDKTGVVEAVRGAHVLPDTNAHGEGERPTWLYAVAFDGPTLWGEAADPGLVVAIDAFEPYLDHA